MRMLARFLKHLAPILLTECGVDEFLEVVGLDVGEGILEFRVKTSDRKSVV